MLEVCIIGGSGFIGTRLCERLIAKGFLPRIVDKVASATFPQLTHVCDVRNLDLLRNSVTGSVLFNLAAEHRDDVRPLSLYHDVNVGGAENVCQVAREKGIETIVFTSSVAVYGFAPKGTGERGQINPFNEYGRTKYAAEQILRAWQSEDPGRRRLVIVRPTVVFGERNRGNVYNLLKQIDSGRFVMIGDGRNAKSMAYVENVCAFLEHALSLEAGVHVFNYVDKPDMDMAALVATVSNALGKEPSKLRIPYPIGYAIGVVFDILAMVTRRKFSVSAIRVKKFCATTVFDTSVAQTGFTAPVALLDALDKTVRFEFAASHSSGPVFYTE